MSDLPFNEIKNAREVEIIFESAKEAVSENSFCSVRFDWLGFVLSFYMVCVMGYHSCGRTARRDPQC